MDFNVNNIFSLVFNIVSISIGFYLISKYLTNIKSSNIMNPRSKIDVNAILYIESFLVGTLISVVIAFIILYTASYYLKADIIISIISIFTINIVSIFFNKKINISKLYQLNLAIGSVGIIAGILVEPIIRNSKDNMARSIYGIVIYIILFFTGLLLIGTIKNTHFSYVNVVFSDPNISTYFSSLPGVTKITPTTHAIEILSIMFVEETDDSYVFSIDSKYYRISKNIISILEK